MFNSNIFTFFGRCLLLHVNSFFTGIGGNAGRIIFYVQNFDGRVDVRSCRGAGAEPANNGAGGKGW